MKKVCIHVSTCKLARADHDLTTVLTGSFYSHCTIRRIRHSFVGSTDVLLCFPDELAIQTGLVEHHRTWDCPFVELLPGSQAFGYRPSGERYSMVIMLRHGLLVVMQDFSMVTVLASTDLWIPETSNAKKHLHQ